jgi:hypothetical protein
MVVTMARDIVGSTIRFRRNTAARWAASNPVLGPGEPGYERDTGRLKLGDGHTPWNDLEYFLPDDMLRALIDQVINSDVSAGTLDASLAAHINSLAPHPVYDDGPSLALLYQNAKV